MDIKPEELFDTMMYILKDNDVVCDFFGCNETLDILHACHLKKGIIYVNASIEENILKPYPSQNALYQAFYAFKKKYNPIFTGCIDAGANPGMITHFSILGIFSMAKSAIERKIADADLIETLLKKKDIPGLAEVMKVDVIHISELEDIEPNDPSQFKGYVFCKGNSKNGIWVNVLVLNKPCYFCSYNARLSGTRPRKNQKAFPLVSYCGKLFLVKHVKILRRKVCHRTSSESMSTPLTAIALALTIAPGTTAFTASLFCAS